MTEVRNEAVHVGDTTEEDEHRIWLDVFKKQIKEKMKRYMERQRDDSGSTKGGYWVESKKDKGGGGETINPKSEYITRLTSLRDSLINQEEANLAQALDRLRLHSITNKSHSKRLRMRTIDDVLSAPPLIHQRKNMVTTVERFRQIRPSRHQPVIFPLQGRQMIDFTSPRPASEEPISNFGNSTNRSSRSIHSENFTARPSHSKLEETVQSNLQRLIQQRTSSIPNIGRKALKNQDGLEPKTSPLLNIRARLQKAQGLTSPFLLSTHEDYDPNSPQARSSGELDVASLSPHAHKLSPVLQGDMLDMDRLSLYYQKLISDMAPEIEREEMREGGGKRKRKSTFEDGDDENRRFFYPKQKYRHSPLKPSVHKGLTSSIKSEREAKHYTSYNSVVSSAGKTIPLSDLPDIASRSTYAFPPDLTYDVSLDNAIYKQRLLPELQTAYRFQMGSGVSDTSSDVYKWYGGKSVYQDKSKPIEDPANMINDPNNNDNTNMTKDGKMKIVVDMPNIIFNAASPDYDGSSDIVEKGQSSNQNSGMNLKKTIKQHELRRRELKNLLEDVKELNTWSEMTAQHSVHEGT